MIPHLGEKSGSQLYHWELRTPWSLILCTLASCGPNYSPSTAERSLCSQGWRLTNVLCEDEKLGAVLDYVHLENSDTRFSPGGLASRGFLAQAWVPAHEVGYQSNHKMVGYCQSICATIPLGDILCWTMVILSFMVHSWERLLITFLPK